MAPEDRTNDRGVKPNPQIPEEDRLRAGMYDFLGALLARPPGRRSCCKSRPRSPATTARSAARIRTLARIAAATGPEAVEDEYNTLFIGLGRGELLPYASYYLTGFLNEKPLAALREDMKTLGIVRADDVFEPEDNIASLFEMMAGMIRGRFGATGFARPLERTSSTGISRRGPAISSRTWRAQGIQVSTPRSGSAGRAFMEIEKEAFRLISG